MSNIFDFLAGYPTYVLIMFGGVVLMFFWQLGYWFSYAQVAVHRHPYREHDDQEDPAAVQGVSVIVVVSNEYDYLEQQLPLIMAQDYPLFEVIAVNDCGGGQMDMALAEVGMRYDNFRFTTLRTDRSFKHSRKIPLLVGIKAARYENLVFVATDASPVSDRWLRYMTRGFRGGSLVIGYCGLERGGGAVGMWRRCSRFIMSVRYLKAAIAGHAYRGIYNNIGYTKSLFFKNKGFTHLNMTCGEDDLFVQRAATADNTSVIINPHCSMRQQAQGGFSRWFRGELYSGYAYRFYPEGVKFRTFMELFTRCALVVLVVGVGITVGLGVLTYVAVGLFVLREVVMCRAVWRIAKRLGERGIVRGYIWYDFFAPAFDVVLCLVRRIWPPSRLWVKGLK